MAAVDSRASFLSSDQPPNTKCPPGIQIFLVGDKNGCAGEVSVMPLSLRGDHLEPGTRRRLPSCPRPQQTDLGNWKLSSHRQPGHGDAAGAYFILFNKICCVSRSSIAIRILGVECRSDNSTTGVDESAVETFGAF